MWCHVMQHMMWGHVITMRSCDIIMNPIKLCCFNPLGACLLRRRLTRRNWINTVPYTSSSLMSLMQSAGSVALSVGALGYTTPSWTNCWPRYTQGGAATKCSSSTFFSPLHLPTSLHILLFLLLKSHSFSTFSSPSPDWWSRAAEQYPAYRNDQSDWHDWWGSPSARTIGGQDGDWWAPTQLCTIGR